MMKADFAIEVNRISSCLLFDNGPLEYLIAPAPAMPISHRFEVKNRVVAMQCPRLNITNEMDRRVATILDSVADFFNDRELTQAQADALDTASSRPPANVKTRELPSRKRQ